MISFIIPTKNEETVLEKTLSLLSQYSGEKEIIISDGRSTDKTIEIAKKYTDKIIIYAGEKRQTIASARNDGAKVAKGEFLVFLDADVMLFEPNNFFEKTTSLFTLKKKLVAITVSIKVLPELANIFDRIIFTLLNIVHMIGNNWFRVGAAPGEFQMIRKDVFEKLGGFNETLTASEDEEMFHRLAKIGETYFDMALTAYHTGRRAHKIGWLKLLWQWNSNYISMILFKKAASKEWKEIR